MSIYADLPSTFSWSAIPSEGVQGESLLNQNNPTIQDVLELLGGEAETVFYEVVATGLAHGCNSSTSTFSCLVQPLPEPAFTTDSQALCDSVEVTFVNESPNGLLFEWNYGDGLASTDVNLPVTFDAPGSYSISLGALDPVTGCEAELEQTFVVNQSPDATFSSSASYVCGQEDVLYCVISS